VTVALGQTATQDNFFVFVGEKISVDTLAPKQGEIPFDRGFIAKYKVIKTLYGNYKKDTIEFEAYIHTGNTPAFSGYKTVLLYLSSYQGKWYQQKYMYDAVYPTKDGKWAGVGKSFDYEHEDNQKTKIKPQPIAFSDSVWFDLKIYTQKEKKWFDSKYYIVKDDKAYPIMGNYIEELFALKKNGYLKARGLF
jgi:hypothetical protein